LAYVRMAKSYSPSLRNQCHLRASHVYSAMGRSVLMRCFLTGAVLRAFTRRHSIASAMSCRSALCWPYSKQIETHLGNNYAVHKVERRRDEQCHCKIALTLSESYAPSLCTSIASRHTPRRWTTCCTRNAYEDVPNACTDPTSTSCPTAHLLHSMERPSPFVATRSYTGRRRVTMLASRARAGSPSTCSPRQR
jgi:hypothetical protein